MSLRCPAESGIVPFEPVTNRRMETSIAEVKTNTARARLASRLVRDCRDTACARSSFQPGNADPIPTSKLELPAGVPRAPKAA